MLKLFTETVQTGLREKFKQVGAKKRFKPDDVDAGREYIEAYGLFLGYVERIYEAAKGVAESLTAIQESCITQKGKLLRAEL